MPILKVTPRGKFTWQCLCRTGERFNSATTASANLNVFRINPNCQLSTSTTPASSFSSIATYRYCQQNVSRGLAFYSTEASSKSQVSEEGTVAESEQNQDQNPEMKQSSSKSQTGEPLPSEQEESDWDSKMDKLYKVIELEVLSYEPSVLDSYQWFVLTAATHLGIKVGKCWSPLKSNKLRFPLLKSAFVHKKHQVHYEVRTYHRFLTFHKLTSSTADTFLEYIERNLPEGVGLKVTKVEAKALPDYLQKK